MYNLTEEGEWTVQEIVQSSSELMLNIIIYCTFNYIVSSNENIFNEIFKQNYPQMKQFSKFTQKKKHLTL